MVSNLVELAKDYIALNLAIAEAAIDERLALFPKSPFFPLAKRDVARIAERLKSSSRVDQSFYDSLSVGLMCARELESVDMPFCEAIYALLTDIRP